MGKSRRSDPRDPNTFDPNEQLDAGYPDSVRAPSVPRGYNSSSPVYLDCRPVYSPTVADKAAKGHKRAKNEGHDNGSEYAGCLRRSVRICSRAQSVELSARSGKPRGRSGARSGAISGASNRNATLPTQGKWDSPASTDEVLEQTLSHLQRNSEKFVRGNSPEPDDLEAYRPLDPSRSRSPIHDDDIVTAGEDEAPFRGRQSREDSCLCTGWKALTKSIPTHCLIPEVARRKHAMAAIPERSKPRTKSRPASLPLRLMMMMIFGGKDAGQFQLEPFAITRSPLTKFRVELVINHKVVPLKSHDMKNQGDKRHPCAACITVHAAYKFGTSFHVLPKGMQSRRL